MTRPILLMAFSLFSISVFGQSTKLNDTSFKLTNQIRIKFIDESKKRGKLDYWSPIKGHELEGEMVEKGWYVSKDDAAIIKWAYALAKSGLKDKTDIVSLYEELKGRKINDSEIPFVDYGYKKALEKR